MPKFFYIARDKSGEKKTGFEDAATEEELVGRLQSKGLLIITVTSQLKEQVGLKADVLAKTKFRPRHSRITSEDLTLFCRQLSTLLGAGVTVLKSLDIISQQVSSRKFQSVIKDLIRSMETGLSFHEAMAKHQKVFSDLWINLVESGEASGNLAIILNRLANYLERLMSFRKKIVSSLIYPVILMIAGLSALLFLTIKIIPTFAEVFKGFNVKMPFLTGVLIAVSAFIRRSLLFMIITVIIGVFLFRKYIATKSGRMWWEKLKFNLPIFGEFFRIIVAERFASEMSTLVESGVPILYSLEITEHSVGNLVMGEIISKIKEGVRAGKPLNQPLEQSGFFEPMAVQMITIGEEIGELSNMFKKLDTFYQEYVETFLSRITAMFEPLMLIFMGLVIGTMVVGMFLPIFQISQIGR
jgi:type IV pilus assembly protein PilC